VQANWELVVFLPETFVVPDDLVLRFKLVFTLPFVDIHISVRISGNSWAVWVCARSQKSAHLNTVALEAAHGAGKQRAQNQRTQTKMLIYYLIRGSRRSTRDI
jgi:hypothetical protein